MSLMMSGGALRDLISARESFFMLPTACLASYINKTELHYTEMFSSMGLNLVTCVKRKVAPPICIKEKLLS